MGGLTGVFQMAEQMGRWVATAGFSEIGSLTKAVESLMQVYADTARICIVGTSDGMARLRAFVEDQTLGVLIEPLQHVEVIGNLKGGKELAAAPGQFDSIDFEAERRTMGLLNGLDDRLEAGDVVLLVEARSLDELAVVTRKLLQHSAHQVRMREYSSGSLDSRRI